MYILLNTGSKCLGICMSCFFSKRGYMVVSLVIDRQNKSPWVHLGIAPKGILFLPIFAYLCRGRNICEVHTSCFYTFTSW